MEEEKTVTKRVTRSRRASFDSPAVGTPKKQTRSAKLKNIDENETVNPNRRESVDDFDDGGSVASSNSIKSCKVVLRREQFDDINIAHRTRLRRSSQLTEENIATHSNTPIAARHLRDDDVASDGSGTTFRTRVSARLASAPNTPSRRSSRLLVENEKTADSPAKGTPRRRNLRSNSVISEDLTPPTESTSSQKSGSQKKGATSKINTENSTPSRLSKRMNKSVIATDVINEETLSEEEEGNAFDKSKQTIEKSFDNEKQDEKNEMNIEKSKDGRESVVKGDSKITVKVVQVTEDIKPILVDGKVVTPNKKSTLKLDSSMTTSMDQATETLAAQSVVLITTTTEKATVNSSMIETEMPITEIPVESMDTSMIEPEQKIISPKGTPKQKTSVTPKGTPNVTPKGTPKGTPKSTPKVSPKSDKITTPQKIVQVIIEKIKTPRTESPKVKRTSNDSNDSNDSKNFNVSQKDTPSSPAINKSLNESALVKADNDDQVNETIIDTETNKSIGKPDVSANISVNKSKVLDDFEPMDVSEIQSETKTAQENLKEYPNKALVSLKSTDMSTPKQKSRSSNTFESMDVSALIDAYNSPQPTKKLAKLKSLNVSKEQQLNVSSEDKETIASSIVDETINESNQNVEKTKMVTPKPKDTPKKVVFTKVTPKSASKTPVKEVANNEKDLIQGQETTDSKMNQSKTESTNPLRPSRRSSFGGLSTSLREEINKLVADFEINEVDERFNEISEAITPTAEQEIDSHFNEIAAKAGAFNANDKESNEEKIQDEANESKKNTSIQANKDKSIVVDEQEVLEQSVPNEISFVTKGITAASSKIPRKSVQIMTPIMDKIQKTQKRIDTPYPDEKSILEASAHTNSMEEAKQKKREEMQANARESLKKLKDSWNKSIKHSIISNESPTSIDRSGVSNTSNTEKQPAKEAVPARNNWGISKGLVDSESESEDSEVVPDTEEVTDDETEESENELIDDGAEVIENYQSGDSMDEDERREIEENRIEEGMDLGSSDTSCDEEGDEYEDDGFIVDDSVGLQNESDDEEEESEYETDEEITQTKTIRVDESSSDDEEEIVQKKPQRKLSRVIESETESETVSDSEDEIVQQKPKRKQSRAIESDDDEVEQKLESELEIVSDSEDEIVQKKSQDKPSQAIEASSSEESTSSFTSASSITTVVTIPVQQSVVVFNGNDPNADKIEDGKTFATTCFMLENETESLETTKKTELSKSSSEMETTSSSEQQEEHTQNEEISQPVQKKDRKGSLLGAIRSSLPGIFRMAKPSTTKISHRVSLGDLNENAQRVPIAQLKSQATKNNRKKVNLNASTSSCDGMSPSDSQKAPLNISSQEENNNQKASSKTETVKQIEIIETQPEDASDETITGHEHVTSTSSEIDEVVEKPNGKRKFIEIDVNEPRERQKKKKLLRIINSASGKFVEEPMTPEKKNKHGFREAPRTPVNRNFKIEKRILVAPKTNKRKSIYLNVEEDEDVSQVLLPRPSWKIETQFNDFDRPNKRARKLELGSTEVILQPIRPNKRAIRSIPPELRRYRHNQLHRAGIPRQDTWALLRERQKRSTRK